MTQVTASTMPLRGRNPYRPFVAAVRRIEQPSPTFRRVTMESPEFAHMATTRLDQHVRLLVPHESGPQGWHRLATMHYDECADWYAAWRAQDAALRNPLRSYTIRDVNPRSAQVVIDIAVHDEAPGPAVRWAQLTEPGEELMLIGPDVRSLNADGAGIGFRNRAAEHALLIGDETALPAITGIIQSREPGIAIEALIEVPTAADFLDIAHRPFTHVSWASRDGWLGESCAHTPPLTWRAPAAGGTPAGHGATLAARVVRWLEIRSVGQCAGTGAGCGSQHALGLGGNGDLADLVSGHGNSGRGPAARGGAYHRDARQLDVRAAARPRLHVWIAGEAAMAWTVRQALVADGIDPAMVEVGAYWRK